MTLATRPDALDLYGTLADVGNTILYVAGQVRVSDVLDRKPDTATIRNARRALTDGLRALDEYEGREG